MVAKVARELGINVTGGSSSIADAWESLRLAAATARAQLLGAASLRWKLPVAELDGRATASSAIRRDRARTTASWRSRPRPRRPATSS